MAEGGFGTWVIGICVGWETLPGHTLVFLADGLGKSLLQVGRWWVGENIRDVRGGDENGIPDAPPTRTSQMFSPTHQQPTWSNDFPKPTARNTNVCPVKVSQPTHIPITHVPNPPLPQRVIIGT